jgi:hypothetical protein
MAFRSGCRIYVVRMVSESRFLALCPAPSTREPQPEAVWPPSPTILHLTEIRRQRKHRFSRGFFPLWPGM